MKLEEVDASAVHDGGRDDARKAVNVVGSELEDGWEEVALVRLLAHTNPESPPADDDVYETLVGEHIIRPSYRAE